MLLCFLSNDSFVLAETSVLHLDEALGCLEEVLVRLVRCKINAEGLRAVRLHLGMRWLDSEWVLHPLAGGLVQDVEQGPVDINSEGVSVLEGD